MPPSRNLGVGNRAGNAGCGGHATLIVAPGARKEKLRRRSWASPMPRAKAPRYAELHAASAFSFLDGASLPEDLVEEAARLEIPAVALVDRNGVYGAPRFYKAAKEAGVKALVGAEATLRQQSRPEERAADVILRRGAPKDPELDRGHPASSPGSLAALGMTGVRSG
jgi:hypothetical protein